ncbi:NAD(P)-dependent oxidoreductase [Amnibacterium kyonggiense]|uniref:3-hydroxyisobutyrate dehydrogenase n=1 Tax=Amnibacterium kyonggiense TaxID=595671 RepID=A0A4R7FSZ8_9MICO|nr:NAD(P)-dependent oxidoreductase [Amnibacterium kyonggiense]TDS80926.1 3-hydroxyisobutyrate dehydrogenase [Amnibacterium kyonggiense]
MPFTPSVALLGTGTMGVGMAHSLLRAGLPVTVWNRHPEKAAPLAGDGATVAESLEEAVRGAHVVVSMLFDEASVAEVMERALPAFDAGTVWVQSSTVGRDGIARLAALAKPHGVPFYDAPVVGTKQPAETGKLTVLASGPAVTRDVVQPVFDAIGGKTVWLGDEAGPASAMKLVANSWVGTITAGTAFAIAQAAAFGLQPSQFLETVSGGAADSPYLQTKGAAIVENRTEDPQFALDGLLKDLRLIRDADRAANVPTTLIDALVDLYADASEQGFGGHDIAAVGAAFRPDDEE